jgi:hypothetical protein
MRSRRPIGSALRRRADSLLSDAARDDWSQRLKQRCDDASRSQFVDHVDSKPLSDLECALHPWPRIHRDPQVYCHCSRLSRPQILMVHRRDHAKEVDPREPSQAHMRIVVALIDCTGWRPVSRGIVCDIRCNVARPFVKGHSRMPLSSSNPQHAGRRVRLAVHSHRAKARTGKEVPPAMAGGTAKKRKPLAGRPSSAARCSTIGIPAARSVVCAGRSESCMLSMLAQSMPTSATPCWTRFAHASPVRYGPERKLSDSESTSVPVPPRIAICVQDHRNGVYKLFA